MGSFYVEGRGNFNSRGSFPRGEIFRGGEFSEWRILSRGGIFRGGRGEFFVQSKEEFSGGNLFWEEFSGYCPEHL